MKMKKIKLILLLAVLIFSTVGKAQLYLPDTDSNLLNNLPKAPKLQSITKTKAIEVFRKIRNEKIEYRYINGSCKDRAHFINLILEKENVKCGKIWVVSPAKYSFTSNETIQLKDPYNINDTTSWGYHVAPVLIVENMILVIDLSFNSQGYLTQREWLSMLNSPKSIYFYTQTKDYIFKTIDHAVSNNGINHTSQQQITDLTIPKITGDFWTLFQSDDVVYRGLAVTDLAIEIQRVIQKEIEGNDKKYLQEVLPNIHSIKNEIAYSSSNTKLSQETFRFLQNYYLERYTYWRKRYKHYNG